MSSPTLRRIAGIMLTAVALCGPLHALADPSARRAVELKKLSLEELLSVELTTAAKRPQSLADTPAAVSVLSGDDIRRSGVRSLPEALRLAAGLHVARFDSRSYGVAARGLNSLTSNKLLVLIDGRAVYTPLYSGVFWDVQDTLLDDVERIEVVRGPAATLWGANAVNGVINVITRHAADTQGGLAYVGGGNEERGFGAVRWGGPLAKGHWRAFAKYDYRDGLVLSSGADADDPLRVARGGFRADLPALGGDLTLSGGLYTGEIGHPTFADTSVDGGDLVASWARRLSDTSSVQLRTWYDHTFRDVPTQLREERHTWDVEGQQRLLHRRHDLLWGLGYRLSEDRTATTELIGWDPSESTLWVANVFFQDQIDLGRGWRLIAGLRVEEQSTMDAELLPSLNLSWTPREGHLLWASVGRAVRAPTRIDRDVRIPGSGPVVIVRGNKDFQAEQVWAYELGYRLAAGSRFGFDTAVFYNDYEDLRTQEVQPNGTILLGNRMLGRVTGVAVSGSWLLGPGARLGLGFTHLDDDLRLEPGSRDVSGGSAEANDPETFWFLRGDFDLPADLELGATLRHVDALPNPAVPAYTELDLRLAWQATDRWTLAVVGQNLLDASHPEIGDARNREEVQRSVFGQLTWSF